MRNFKTFCTVAIFLFLPAALCAQKVGTDYDRSADFSQYKTYTWLREPRIQDPLMRQQVMDAVNATLTAKGLQLVPGAATADVGVVANGATREEHTLQTFYDGFGGWRWMGWNGTATTTENTYEVGTLVVDLFDMKTKRVIWRGTATETLSDKPDKNAEKITKSVEKMFKDFPPKAKG